MSIEYTTHCQTNRSRHGCGSLARASGGFPQWWNGAGRKSGAVSPPTTVGNASLPRTPASWVETQRQVHTSSGSSRHHPESETTILSTWGCTCAQRAGKSHKHDLLWAFDHNDVAPSGIDGHRWHTCHAELLGSLNWWTIFKEFINIPLLPLFSRFAFFSQSTDHHPTQPGAFEAYLQTKNLKTRSPQ